MWKNIFVLIFVTLIINTVDSAMKKSWKSPANFESNVPKFTPFENIVRDSETEELPITTKKISAKIKAHGNHVADLYNDIKDSKKVSQYFGSFAYHVPATSSEEEEEEIDNEIQNKLLNHNLSNEGNDEDDNDFDIISNDDLTQYKVGQLMNVSVNNNEDTVNVNLDHQSLKEIFTGRGRRHSMLERVVPLFIIPFLIQAAIVPFMVTTIKLFLMKSLFAGKIAILFFILGALKSHQNSIYMKSLQNPPLFLKDYPAPFLPERRLETSFDGYKFDGYKVDGKPEAFIN